MPVLEPAVPLPKFNVEEADREKPTSAFHDSAEPAVRDTVVNAPEAAVVAPMVPLKPVALTVPPVPVVFPVPT